MNVSIIVAQTRNRMIGKDNDFPWYLSNDLKRFKDLTTGHSIVMGRKSFEHILERTKGRLLPDRTHVVITRDTDYSYPGIIVVHSLQEAIDAADSDEVFVIGGGQIYEQALPLADKIYLTQINAEIDGDTYFPEIDDSQWQEISRESHSKDEKNDYDYDFVELNRKSK